MSQLIPVNLIDALRGGLAGTTPERSQNLYCGSDLIGPLRHSMLRVAGAPTIEPELVGEVVMQTGNFWHKWFGERLVTLRIPFMQEVSLKPWLPEGWSGTADWLFWHEQHEAFVLGDLKTTKGESLQYLHKQGIKDTHLWQLSAYWHALERMGIPLVKGFGVLYLPMNDVPREQIEPIILEANPIPREVVYERMESRAAATKAYLEEVKGVDGVHPGTQHLAEWPDIHRKIYVTDSLAPPMEREHRLYWDRKAGHWNVVLVPHWSTRYCPYPVDLCDCSTQGTTKIGHWWAEGDGEGPNLQYQPRKGFEDIIPVVQPDQKEVRKQLG